MCHFCQLIPLNVTQCSFKPGVVKFNGGESGLTSLDVCAGAWASRTGQQMDQRRWRASKVTLAGEPLPLSWSIVHEALEHDVVHCTQLEGKDARGCTEGMGMDSSASQMRHFHRYAVSSHGGIPPDKLTITQPNLPLETHTDMPSTSGMRDWG